MTELTNWSGNYSYQAPRLHRPDSIEELQHVVAGSERVKALGSRHCFNDIADTAGDLIELDAMPELIEVDVERRQRDGERRDQVRTACPRAGAGVARAGQPGLPAAHQRRRSRRHRNPRLRRRQPGSGIRCRCRQDGAG